MQGRPIAELADAVRAGRVTAEALTAAALGRASHVQAATNAFFQLDPDAPARAAAIDEAVMQGRDPGPLAGVPVVLKDNLLHAGRPCTCGSRILAGYVAPVDAEVVRRLLAAGAVVVGRGNMDEFAMGSSTETCAWGPVRNPWDLDRVPGGSSGGSAAAVAGGAVPVALGSETGGSARLPAAFTGLVGLKPTYGRVSRRGLVAYASSTDQVAPLGRTVRDVARITAVIAGHDPRDPTSSEAPVPDLEAACDRGVAGLRLGVPAEYFEGLDPGVAAAVERGLQALRDAGATLVPVSLPSTALAVACYYVIAPAEASSNLARFDGVRYGPRVEDPGGDSVAHTRSAGFGREVRRRILVGTWVLSAGHADAFHRSALRVRARLSAELDGVLATVDALVTPTAATTAFRLGERADPVAMYRTDALTIPASLAGLPAISVPCGLSDGLPVGLQVMARRFDEPMCLSVAAAVEASGAMNRAPTGRRTTWPSA